MTPTKIKTVKSDKIIAVEYLLNPIKIPIPARTHITAAEVTPVASIDKITVGPGKRGPVTEKLQTAFFDIALGKAEDNYGWLKFV